MEILQGVWKQHLRPRAVVGYGDKIFLPSPPNYVTRSPGSLGMWFEVCRPRSCVDGGEIKVSFDPWRRSFFVLPANAKGPKEKMPLLAEK